MSGSAFRVVVMARSDEFLLLKGYIRTYVKTADSGRRRAQAFCPECGTQIYGSAASNPSRYSIRVGTANQRQYLKPTRQIWCKSSLDWLPNFPGVEKEE